VVLSSSRAVLYAGSALEGEHGFAAAARRVALATRSQLQQARPLP
jgi:hypothetical protein